MSAMTKHQRLKLVSNIAEKIFKAVAILTVSISLCVPLGPMEGFTSSSDFITRQPGTEKYSNWTAHWTFIGQLCPEGQSGIWDCLGGRFTWNVIMSGPRIQGAIVFTKKEHQGTSTRHGIPKRNFDQGQGKMSPNCHHRLARGVDWWSPWLAAEWRNFWCLPKPKLEHKGKIVGIVLCLLLT